MGKLFFRGCHEISSLLSDLGLAHTDYSCLMKRVIIEKFRVLRYRKFSVNYHILVFVVFDCYTSNYGN